MKKIATQEDFKRSINIIKELKEEVIKHKSESKGWQSKFLSQMEKNKSYETEVQLQNVYHEDKGFREGLERAISLVLEHKDN